VADEVFVKTGATRGDQVVITKGVSAGQMVVTSGQMKLKPGSQVKIDNSVSPKNDPNPAPQEQ
jgi:membrane fusion protein (multidrug efflux system)